MIKRLVQSTPVVAKINVTPIIDVALVLVIILLITAPMLATVDFGLELPASRTRNLDAVARVNVTLGPHGELAIDDRQIQPDYFRAELVAALVAHDPDEEVVVVLRADEMADHSSVRRLMQESRAAGAGRLAIATRPSGGSQ